MYAFLLTTAYGLFDIEIISEFCLTFYVIFNRFCGGHFPERTEATIGVDFREKKLKIEQEEIMVNM